MDMPVAASGRRLVAGLLVEELAGYIQVGDVL